MLMQEDVARSGERLELPAGLGGPDPGKHHPHHREKIKEGGGGPRGGWDMCFFSRRPSL